MIEKELSRRAKEASNVEKLTPREIISKKELSKLSHEQDRLLDAYQSGVIDLKELKKRNFNLNERKNSLENDIQGLQAVRLQVESLNLEACLTTYWKKCKQKQMNYLLTKKES